MRGFKARESAQTICAGHGFIRNLREGFYDLGMHAGDPRVPQAPHTMACAFGQPSIVSPQCNDTITWRSSILPVA